MVSNTILESANLNGNATYNPSGSVTISFIGLINEFHFFGIVKQPDFPLNSFRFPFFPFAETLQIGRYFNAVPDISRYAGFDFDVKDRRMRGIHFISGFKGLSHRLPYAIAVFCVVKIFLQFLVVKFLLFLHCFYRSRDDSIDFRESPCFRFLKIGNRLCLLAYFNFQHFNPKAGRR